MSQVLSERLGVPVLEGIACAVEFAEILVDLGVHTTRVGQYLLLPKQKKLIGFPEFQDLYCYTKG